MTKCLWVYCPSPMFSKNLYFPIHLHSFSPVQFLEQFHSPSPFAHLPLFFFIFNNILLDLYITIIEVKICWELHAIFSENDNWVVLHLDTTGCNTTCRLSIYLISRWVFNTSHRHYHLQIFCNFCLLDIVSERAWSFS